MHSFSLLRFFFPFRVLLNKVLMKLFSFGNNRSLVSLGCIDFCNFGFVQFWMVLNSL